VVYTMRIIFPTYSLYLLSVFKKLCKREVAISFLIYSVLWMLFDFAINPHHRQVWPLFENYLIWNSMGVFALIVFSVFGAVIMWKQKFEIAGSTLVDYFPFKKIYYISDISHIVLASQNTAHIMMNANDSGLIPSLYWFGNSEKEWIEFVEKLAELHPELKNRIYWKTTARNGNKRYQVDYKEAYSKVRPIYE
jgi:hypothetical protein